MLSVWDVLLPIVIGLTVAVVSNVLSHWLALRRDALAEHDGDCDEPITER